MIIIDDSVQLTVSSEGIVIDSSKMSRRTFDSENFNKKDENVNTKTPILKPVSINEPKREPWHASVDSPVQPIGQKSLMQAELR